MKLEEVDKSLTCRPQPALGARAKGSPSQLALIRWEASAPVAVGSPHSVCQSPMAFEPLRKPYRERDMSTVEMACGKDGGDAIGRG